MQTDKYIKEELKAVSPLLAKAKSMEGNNSSGYDFIKMQEAVIQKIRKEEVTAELQNTAPLLLPAEKATAQNPSAAYFEQLQKNVFERINEQHAVKQQPTLSALDIFLDRLSGWLTPQTQLAFSVLFTGAFLVSVLLTQTDSKNELSFETEMLAIPSDEIQKYLATNIDDFDLQTITDNAEIGNTEDVVGGSESWKQEIENFLNNELDDETIEYSLDLI